MSRKIQWCECRNCKKKYDEWKSTADWRGYCSMKCQHEKAKSLGWSSYQESKAPSIGTSAYHAFRVLHPDEHQVLRKYKQIGSVPWKPVGTRGPNG